MQTSPKSITFTVDEVEPAHDRLQECYAYHGLGRLTGQQAIACSEYSSPVVRDVEHNPFVYAIHKAYADHRPVVLSPDIIWLTISQGIKHHILMHSDGLREAFVSHPGKRTIVVDLGEDFILDSPYADWESVIDAFGERILEQLDEEKRGLLIERFSTTGNTEYTAYIINMMDAFQRYFDYVARYICGIPEITLEGITADWERIVEKARPLDDIGLSWWRERLDPVLLQFVRASRGDIDLHHWRSIYKVVEAYGKDKLTGWITTLFPYLRDKYTGALYRNEDLGMESESPESPNEKTPGVNDRGVKLDEFPIGLSSAPIQVRAIGGTSIRKLEVSAGFTGIRQVGENGALKPMIGWAVCKQTKMQRLLDEIETKHAASTGGQCGQDYATEFPGELSALYDRFDEVLLFRRRLSRSTRIRPRSSANWFYFTKIGPLNVILNGIGVYVGLADRLERSRHTFIRKFGDRLRRPINRFPLQLYRFADLSDGSHVAFVFTEAGGWHCVRFRRGLQGPRLPVIAKSVQELLENLLASPKPEFPDHGSYEIVREEQEFETVYRENA